MLEGVHAERDDDRFRAVAADACQRCIERLEPSVGPGSGWQRKIDVAAHTGTRSGFVGMTREIGILVVRVAMD